MKNGRRGKELSRRWNKSGHEETRVTFCHRHLPGVVNSARVARRQNPEQVFARICKQQYINQGETFRLIQIVFARFTTWETSAGDMIGLDQLWQTNEIGRKDDMQWKIEKS